MSCKLSKSEFFKDICPLSLPSEICIIEGLSLMNVRVFAVEDYCVFQAVVAVMYALYPSSVCRCSSLSHSVL